jgi:hypothetical protein
MRGLWVSTILTTFWIALGSWVAIFPDTLERLFGVGYGFKDSWSVSQGTFEVLTLGTLAVIVLFGVIGYIAGAGVRSNVVDVPLETEAATVPA